MTILRSWAVLWGRLLNCHQLSLAASTTTMYATCYFCKVIPVLLACSGHKGLLTATYGDLRPAMEKAAVEARPPSLV